MKQTLQIMADFDKPDLLKDMVEKLVSRRSDKRPSLSDRETIETSSTEAYVCGTISLNEEENVIRLPFDSSFLFSCIRGINGEYEVTWSASLS
jgi:hypothetical protein